MKEATFLKLSVKDLLKGFLVAMFTVITTGLVSVLDSGHLPTFAAVKSLFLTGLCAGLAYLLKNFLTNSQDQFGKTEPKK